MHSELAVPTLFVIPRNNLSQYLSPRLRHTLIHSDDYPLNTYCRNWRTPCGIGYELERQYTISTLYEKAETKLTGRPVEDVGAEPPKWGEYIFSEVFWDGNGLAYPRIGYVSYRCQTSMSYV